MSVVTIEGQRVRIGAWFAVSFQRTLRLPDDGKTYPLPPGLGAFPVHRVDDFADRVPAHWREKDGVFLPIYQRESLWLNFDGPSWHPTAVKVGVGRVDALTGAPWDETLEDSPQNYLVSPDQPWLDGIKTGKDQVRQFVATRLGKGDTVEGQVTGQERHGGIQICVFNAMRGHFPDTEPEPTETFGPADDLVDCVMSFPETDMGLAAGGTMRQKIYPDRHGLATWDQASRKSFEVHLVDATRYREITGQSPPPSPIEAADYTRAGLPWFDLYDENAGDLPAVDTLRRVKSLQEREKERGGAPRPGDQTVDVPASQVERLVNPHEKQSHE